MFSNSSKQDKKKRGQGITKVSSLFEKYKKTLRAPQKTIITHFITITRELLNSDTLKEEYCAYSPASRIISVRVSGMVKSEIQLRKKEILTKLQEELGEKSAPKDII